MNRKAIFQTVVMAILAPALAAAQDRPALEIGAPGRVSGADPARRRAAVV